MAFLRQCLQLQRLHQGLDSIETDLNSEDIVDALKVIAASHELNKMRDKKKHLLGLPFQFNAVKFNFLHTLLGHVGCLRQLSDTFMSDRKWPVVDSQLFYADDCYRCKPVHLTVALGAHKDQIGI
jgi:hypothetical protein